MFVAGWGMLENPPQPPLTVNTLLNAALLWVALMFLTLCLMAVFSFIKVAFPKTFLPFKRARVEFRESGIMVAPEDTSKSFETPWSDIKDAREHLDFVYIPVVFGNKRLNWITQFKLPLKKVILIMDKQRLTSGNYNSLKGWLSGAGTCQMRNAKFEHSYGSCVALPRVHRVRLLLFVVKAIGLFDEEKTASLVEAARGRIPLEGP
jgi:hypothetical protein